MICFRAGTRLAENVIVILRNCVICLVLKGATICGLSMKLVPAVEFF